MQHEQLKAQMADGLLSFPVTPFRADLSLDEARFSAHVDWLSGFGAAALFVAGGTGEFFSLTPREVARVVRLGKEAAGATPDHCRLRLWHCACLRNRP